MRTLSNISKKQDSLLVFFNSLITVKKFWNKIFQGEDKNKWFSSNWDAMSLLISLYPLWIFHNSWLSFTGVRVTASLLRSPGPSWVFWPMSAMEQSWRFLIIIVSRTLKYSSCGLDGSYSSDLWQILANKKTTKNTHWLLTTFGNQLLCNGGLGTFDRKIRGVKLLWLKQAWDIVFSLGVAFLQYYIRHLFSFGNFFSNLIF